MPATPTGSLDVDDLVVAAREIIRSEDDHCVVSIFQLLDELSAKFGDRFSVSSDVYTVLNLIETLWEDPHIDQVPDTGWIEFAWNEEGYYPDLDPGPPWGLKARLRQSHISPATDNSTSDEI
jgi:hypothetical protein